MGVSDKVLLPPLLAPSLSLKPDSEKVMLTRSPGARLDRAHRREKRRRHHSSPTWWG